MEIDRLKTRIANAIAGAERYSDADDHTYKISQQRLACFVGGVALGMPWLLLALSALLGVCYFDSISHYYHGVLTGDVFVGALTFIAAFLLAYRGAGSSENRLASFAGVCALGVAFFPVSGAGCERASFVARGMAAFTATGDDYALERLGDGWFQGVLWNARLVPPDWAHGTAAFVLFATLAYFCLRLFPRVAPGRPVSDQKARRNAIYYVSGGVIALCLVAMGLKIGLGDEWTWWDDWNLTFAFELVALQAFGVSWLVKGRSAIAEGVARAVASAGLRERDERDPWTSSTGLPDRG